MDRYEGASYWSSDQPTLSERELLEWAASISPRAEAELRRLERAEAEARHEREELEWLASISERHERELSALIRREAEERQAHEKPRWLAEEKWVEADHPRQPKGTPDGGEWVPKGGGGESGGESDGSGSGDKRDPKGRKSATPEMLDLAHAWWQTNRLLQKARRDIEDLPKRIAHEQSLYGAGGRYAHLRNRYVAKAQRDLEAAKKAAPELEKQLRDLEQQYHDLGYDDVPYSTWTRDETQVGGPGIADVGRAVALDHEPDGLEPTGDEFTVALAVPGVLQLGKAILRRAAAKTAASLPRLAAFTPGGKTAGVLRTASADIPLVSGRAGAAASLPKGTPGFNAITSTHVEGHAAAIMRQKGLRQATVYINNPQICLPCEQNLAHMLPSGSKLTVVLPDGKSRVFVGNAR